MSLDSWLRTEGDTICVYRHGRSPHARKIAVASACISAVCGLAALLLGEHAFVPILYGHAVALGLLAIMSWLVGLSGNSKTAVHPSKGCIQVKRSTAVPFDRLGGLLVIERWQSMSVDPNSAGSIETRFVDVLLICARGDESVETLRQSIATELELIKRMPVGPPDRLNPALSMGLRARIVRLSTLRGGDEDAMAIADGLRTVMNVPVFSTLRSPTGDPADGH